MTDAVGRVALPAAAPGFDSKWVLIGVPVALVVWLALVPLVFLLWQSFLTPQSAAAPAQFHAGEFPLRLSQRRQRPPVLQLAAVRRRRRGALACGRHQPRLDERAHQHPVQDAVLRARDHPAGDSRHPVHGGVDHAGEPEDRRDQSRRAEAVRYRRRAVQHLLHGGNDLGRRAALFADGVPADDGGVPLHGSVARGTGGDERRLGAADRAADHFAAGLAGGARIAADPVRALDRIVRGAGAARAPGRHPRLHVVDLPGDPPVSEPDRACRRLCGDAAAADLARHLRAVAALASGRSVRDGHRQGVSPAHHRSRPLALSHGGDLHPVLRRDRAVAVPGAGVVVAAEILQRAVVGGA